VIPNGFIQDLLSRVDVVDVVGRHVELKKAGINHKGLCPFHGEKTPSFIVSPSRQTYHCFGCGAHGDALRFLMEHAGMGFIDAVHDLAQQVGMAVPEDDTSPEERARAAETKARQATLTEVLARATEHYRKQLKNNPRAIGYLKGRGLTGQIAARFGMGYAPEGWRGLASVYPKYDDPLLVESGLVIVQGENEADQKRYDRFRDRIMFPIRSVQGEVIGFGGRVLDKGEPKYLNSPETPVFVKGRELYGLYEARQALREKGYVLVVEGYMDVVALAQLGFPNAVATLGTACTADHVHKLFRFTESVVFSFDGDAAGRRAAGRALEAALQHATDTRTIRFLFLPPEHDPDSYVREYGPEAFERCVAEAVPLSRQLIDTAQEGCDLGSPEGRARFLAQARPLWQALPEGNFRRQMLGELAQLSGLGTEELQGQWRTAEGPGGRRGAASRSEADINADIEAHGHEGGDDFGMPEQPRGERFRGGDRFRGNGYKGDRFKGDRFRSDRPPGGQRKLIAGTPTLLDRALWLLLARCELWNQLSPASHDLLADQPAPYGPAFAWLERHLNDRGPESHATLVAEMAAEDFGPQGQALVQRLAQLHEPEAEVDLAKDLAIVLDRLQLRALEDEQRLLAESGDLSEAAIARARELHYQCADLKKKLTNGPPA
jgi:DNA primase